MSYSPGLTNTLSGATSVQGTAAAGSPVSGNPVLTGGEDPSGDVAAFQTAADGDQVVHQHSSSTALADGVSNTMHIPVNQTDLGFLGTPTAGYVFNGSTWDRQRGVVQDTPEYFSDASFVSGDSPVTLDLNAALGRNASSTSVTNDGAGNFTVAYSTDGVTFGDAITVKYPETLSLADVSVDSIRITWVADSAYRVIAI
jgi:hypothetical protein